jgi:hypothetical protein
MLNNENFEIYPSDTKDTILIRVAAKMNTSVQWVFLVNQESNLRAFNMFKYVSEKFNYFYSVDDIETDPLIQKWISKNPDAMNLCATLYISLYYRENINKENVYFIIQTLADFFRGSDYHFEFISDTIDSVDDFFINYEDDVEAVKNAKINQRILSEVNLSYSDWELLNIYTIFKIKLDEEIVLNNILNKISDVEFSDGYKLFMAQNEKFIKITDEFKRTISDYDFIQDGSLNIILYKNKLFREINIKKESNLILSISVNIDKYLDIEEIADIIGIKKKNITIIETSKKKMSGKITINNVTFDKYLILDIIMNQENLVNFYHYERKKVSKNLYRLNLIYTSEKVGNVSIKLLSDNNNTELFISKVNSMQIVELIRKEVLFLLKEYMTKELELYEEYLLEFPDFISENFKLKKEKKNKNILMQIEPTLFLPLYSRKCAKPPRILDEGENVPENFEIMEFPLFNEGNLKKRKYICDNSETHIYPGLRKNSLTNNNIFNFIPCCYETSQFNRLGSGLNAYLQKKDKEIIERYDTTFHKTSRILTNDNQGFLPQGIVNLIGDTAIRKGVHIGPNSFIDCVLRATTNLKKISDLNVNRYKKFLQKVRIRLSWEVCLQENSDIDNITLKNWFQNGDLYFEPRRFFRSLEEFFKVNIYFFERNADYVNYIKENKLFFKKIQTPNGILGLPNIPNKGAYIIKKKFQKTIYVYVHSGSSVDILEYPHVENIITYNDPELVESVFNKMLGYYIQDTEINNNIMGQLPDDLGRIRKLLIKNKIVELDFPMSPFTVPIFIENSKENKEKQNNFGEYVYMKRLSRVFLEYCMIKYSMSGLNIETFISKSTKIINRTYPRISKEIYKISDYDNIFSQNGQIIFDSVDTRERIKYSLQKLEKRNGKMSETFVINSYFQNTLDFEDYNVFNQESFEEILYSVKQGELFNNFLKNTDSNLIISIDVKYPDINGYFRVFNDTNSAREYCKYGSVYYLKENYNKWFVWKKLKWEIYLVPSEIKGNVFIVYKIVGKTYVLVKTFHLENS